MNNDKLSRYLSYVLRHNPSSLSLKLDLDGYCFVEELLDRISRFSPKHKMSLEKLKEVVATDKKTRYSFSKDGNMIRANQGHSISTVDVTFNMHPEIPPKYLYHGTTQKTWETISYDGIRKMTRHAVHLSKDEETARTVGSRRGDPKIIRINAKKMHDDGIVFYKTINNVWLVDYVSPDYYEYY